MCMLSSKLPGKLRDGWNREVYSIRARHCKESQFKDLINYVEKVTTLVNYTLFSKEAAEQYLDKENVRADKNEKLEVMLSNMVKAQRVKYKIWMYEGKYFMCDASHYLCMIAVYSCHKQIKIVVRCCSNKVR